MDENEIKKSLASTYPISNQHPFASDAKKKNTRKTPDPIPEETRRQVKTLAGLGINCADISIVVGIPAATLTCLCAKELHEGIVLMNSNVAKSLYQNALSGNVAAQIFWMKARCKWQETHNVNFSGQVAQSFTLSLGPDLDTAVLPAPIPQIVHQPTNGISTTKPLS